MAMFRRSGSPRRGRLLVASGAALDITDKDVVKREKRLRQAWQPEAWAYRDLIPELRYAHDWLGSAVSRMRLFAAAYTDDPAAPPVPAEEVSDLPTGLADAARAQMERLGSGRMAIAALLHTLSVNLEVPGETYLVGLEEPGGQEDWTIRSVDELVPTDEGYRLRDLPADGAGYTVSGELLDPRHSYVARLWRPHPRYRALADSPSRAIIEICEELLDLSRGVRAAAKSRAMTNGLLLVPEELSVAVGDQSDSNPTADPFMTMFTRALMAAIVDEGSPSAVVPMVLRGPSDILETIKYLRLERDIDRTGVDTRAELIRRIATGIDLPPEVLLGTADANHWTAWQISADTFRHHIEPKVLFQVDSLTAGFLWPALAAEGFDAAEYRRVVIWFDPTELIKPPDHTANALQLFDRGAISWDALRQAAGFAEADEPTPEQLLMQLIARLKALPPPVVQAVVQRMDPTLKIKEEVPPPIQEPDGNGNEPSEQDPPAEQGPPEDDEPPTGPPANPSHTVQPITAAGGRSTDPYRFAVALADSDRSIIDRLQVAADAEMRQLLGRAGARIRTRVRADHHASSAINGIANMRVCATLGRARVLAAYAELEDEGEDSRWDQLAEFWRELIAAALAHIHARLGHLIPTATAADLAELGSLLHQHADAAWQWLATALNGLFRRLLYTPDPEPVTLPDEPAGPVLSDGRMLIPARLIRAALAMAGGAGGRETSPGLGTDGTLADPTELLGGLALGADVLAWLAQHQVRVQGWEWRHFTLFRRAFQPHLELDGLHVTGLSDPQLINASAFPPTATLFPGDHEGCRCDLIPLLHVAASEANAQAA
ncbi:proline-rich domain-containing protein [Frankia sp. AvcI1]|uniref:proline-rich domain-containing protein n=1 Tax=Frankia sp. AvcI1 TaxID=573496 RepID=UPI0021187F1C|nr:proline-rich domain-containing protein [Frankia sp. AvcI1]